MKNCFGAPRALRTAVVALSLLAAGCGSGSSSSQTAAKIVSIDPKLLLASITASTQQTVARSLEGWEWGSFVDSFGTLLTSVSYSLEMQKVSYQAIGADGKTHAMTGLLILPKSLFGSRPSVPILLFQHGTEPYRPYSPSRYLANLNRPKDYPEVMVAAMIASTGYAVVMADYEGLGDNTNIQPYVHGTTLAGQVIGMLRASRDIIANDSGSPCSWNNQLFLMGYSEGGYVTMTTTRELQLNHAAEFTVTAAAPLSGPHDLSGEMRTLMLADSGSKAPYFLPFLLTGYNYAPGGTLFNPATAMIPPFNTSIPPLFAGTTPADQISEAMGMDFDPATLVVPKDLLAADFVARLADVASPEVAYLRKNDSYRDPLNSNFFWKPTVPIRMYHHRNDELVPYANSQVAFNAFSTVGAKSRSERGPGVQLKAATAIIGISTDPVKTVHLGAAFPELSEGWHWLDGFVSR